MRWPTEPFEFSTGGLVIGSLPEQSTGMISPIPNIRRRKLSDDVREILLQRIQRGELAPGDLMPSERELMQAHNVGRPAIREAMQSLQGMGLVVIRHGGRARVAEPSLSGMIDQMGETMRHLLAHSPASLEQLKEARIVFEAEMARVAAHRRSVSDLKRLKNIMKSHSDARDDLETFVIRDGDFHREIAAISGNPIFSALAGALFQWLAHFYRGAVSVPGLESLTLEEHGEILAAIEARDPDRAARAMTDHLSRANDLYRQQHYPAVP
ncbi:MAG TPA: transcriptional regulator NanR [Afifellaceae bacterium]|nr:transcriptional regulator NanR [Afifellaceae bacterium]